MPLTLTTPVSAGDLHPGVSQYAEVKVVDLRVSPNSKRIEFVAQLGNTVEGVWVPGIAGPRTFRLTPDQYDTLTTTHATNDGELTYNAVSRGLYEWLVAEGHFAGSVS